MKPIKLEDRNYTKKEVEEIMIQVRLAVIEEQVEEQLIRMDKQFDCLKRFDAIVSALDPTENANYKKIKCDRV